VKIGDHVMLQGGTLLSKDVPPYITVRSDTSSYAGLNRIGLQRRGFTDEQLESLTKTCRILFQSGLNYLNACNEAEAQVPQSPERDALIEFIRNSERGVIKPYTSK
jgi:UDP-N-acetylglucosamine acyltransferase